MATGQVQISALVSEETHALLEEATEACGLEAGPVIEAALLHYLQALRELPPDVVLSSRLVLTEASALRVQEALATAREPTPALRALMVLEDGDDVQG